MSKEILGLTMILCLDNYIKLEGACPVETVYVLGVVFTYSLIIPLPSSFPGLNHVIRLGFSAIPKLWLG